MDTELQQLAKTDRNPVQETRYQELLRSQNQPSAGGSNLASLAQQQLQLQREATQPAVNALEQSRPLIQQGVEQQKQNLTAQEAPLKQRYQNILDELTRREKVQTQSAELATSREYGKRGIPLSSGVYDQALGEARRPINEYYTGQIKDTNLAQNQDLLQLSQQIAGLPLQQAEKENLLNQAIANLQSGGAQAGISNALDLLKFNQQSDFQNKQLGQQYDLAQQSNQLQRDLSQPQQKNPYVTLGEGSTLFNLLSGQPMFTAPKTYKPEGGPDGGASLESLASQFGF